MSPEGRLLEPQQLAVQVVERQPIQELGNPIQMTPGPSPALHSTLCHYCVHRILEISKELISRLQLSTLVQNIYQY